MRCYINQRERTYVQGYGFYLLTENLEINMVKTS